MTSTDRTAVPASFEIDLSLGEGSSSGRSSQVADELPPVNPRASNCGNCGASVPAGAGSVVSLGGERVSVRCRKCRPRPDAGPRAVATVAAVATAVAARSAAPSADFEIDHSDAPATVPAAAPVTVTPPAVSVPGWGLMGTHGTNPFAASAPVAPATSSTVSHQGGCSGDCDTMPDGAPACHTPIDTLDAFVDGEGKIEIEPYEAPVAAPLTGPAPALVALAPQAAPVAAPAAAPQAPQVTIVTTAPAGPVSVPTVVEIVNRFPAACRDCGNRVCAQQGRAYRTAPSGGGGGAWASRHNGCERVGAYVWRPTAPAAVALTPAQARARDGVIPPTATAATPAPTSIAAAKADAGIALEGLAAADRGLAESLTDAVQTGAAMAATSHLVRGGVLASEVNSYAGFVGGAGNRAVLGTDASAATFGGTTQIDETRALPARPTVEVVEARFTGEVKADGQLSSALAAAINSSRARKGTLARSSQPVTVAATVTAVRQTAEERDATRTQASNVRGAITAGTVVAGARSDADGFMIGWGGHRERTRAQLIEALTAAGMPREWAPASKSAKAHAGRAIDSANGWTWGESRLVARAADGTEITKADRNRGVTARWTLQTTRAATGQVGEAAGRIVCTVELVKRGENVTIETRGESQLGARVVKEYDRLAEGDIYKAGDVTSWLQSVLNGKLGAVDFGPNSHYVRRGQVEAAEALCAALRAQGWGRRWITPALPITTGEEMRAGLVNAFADEARAVVKRAWNLLTDAREAKRAAIGDGAAEGLRKELLTVAERASQYEALLGTDAVGAVAEEIKAAIAQIDTMCDATTARGFMLELD